jgi:hypothetical protein
MDIDPVIELTACNSEINLYTAYYFKEITSTNFLYARNASTRATMIKVVCATARRGI